MKKVLVGNWKMNCNKKEAEKLTKEVVSNIGNFNFLNLEIVLCPPFTALETVYRIVREGGAKIKLGAQNCYFLPYGAYTGEVSPRMLADFCDYVILGHSERRRYFNEDDALINKKIKAVLEEGLRPIVCVGEWEKGDSKEGILEQVRRAIQNINSEHMKKLIFAYEPVWAIGTGDEAEPTYANKIVREIKEITNGSVFVLYGGSVTSSNILNFIAQPMIDGALIGGASIKSEEFLKIIEKVRDYVGQS